MMMLRRQPKRTIDPQFAPLLAELLLAYEEGIARCYEVAAAKQIDDELQRRALATACRIAYVSRATWEALLNLDLINHIPEKHNPVRAMAASARLAYSLTATAEDDPEPQTILSIGELDGLPVQYELREWLEMYGSADAAAGNKE
jgi:hypothetical protein